MLTTRPRLAPSRTAGLTDRYKRAWALHMKKYGRFGWYVDPVELEKRLKAVRKHLDKWGYCRGSEWTDEELADQKLKAGKRWGDIGRKNLTLYGYARGSKVPKAKLKRQKKAAGKGLGKGGSEASAAARQAKGAFPTTPHVGVSWSNAKDKWLAVFNIRGVDGKERTHVNCGTFARDDDNKAAEAIATKRTALGLPPAGTGEEVSDEVIRAATKMVEETKRRRPAGPESGYSGVIWHNARKVWHARVGVPRVGDVFVGAFKDKKKAIAAVEARREQEGRP